MADADKIGQVVPVITWEKERGKGVYVLGEGGVC